MVVGKYLDKVVDKVKEVRFRMEPTLEVRGCGCAGGINKRVVALDWVPGI